MTKVSRNDIFTRGERGPDWFNEFLRSLADSKSSTVQDILSAINNNRNATVESIIKDYREQVGMDSLGQIDDADDDSLGVLATKNASGLGPIAPMKLRKLESPDDILKNYDDKDIIIQIKLDGFKTQAIKDGNGSVKMYTRNGEDFTSNIPKLVEDLESKMKSGSFVLGELVWEDSKGKQSISDIQTVVGSSPENAQEKIKSGSGKAVFYVYDLLWESGKDITKENYENRYNKLKKLVGKGSDAVKVVENYSYGEKDKAINAALKVNAEGIVLKPKDSEYKYGAKGSTEQQGEWAKFKPGAKAKVDEVVLNKYEKGKDKLIFPMYQYKDKELFEVGKISGMSKEDEAKIKKDIDAGKNVVVEVTYQEKTTAGKFRHTGWSRFRPDKPAKEVKISSFRPLSVRHAQEMQKSVISEIENNPELNSAIDSFCEHSGGTKNTHAIIEFLRGKLGNEKVRYTDKELVDYIDKRKEHFKGRNLKRNDTVNVGLVGTDAVEDYSDNVADYVTHGAK